jgi:hypothetical protein
MAQSTAAGNAANVTKMCEDPEPGYWTGSAVLRSVDPSVAPVVLDHEQASAVWVANHAIPPDTPETGLKRGNFGTLVTPE